MDSQPSARPWKIKPDSLVTKAAGRGPAFHCSGFGRIVNVYWVWLFVEARRISSPLAENALGFVPQSGTIVDSRF